MNVSRGVDGLTVLYVGSDRQQTESIRTYLDGLGEAATGLTAGTVEEAERIAEREHLTGVVAQYDLPDGDGIAFLNHCLERQPELLTVLVSEADAKSLIDRAYEAGVDEFVHYTGPGKSRVIEHHLASYLGRHETPAGHPRTSRHMETLAETTSDAIVSVDESSTVRYANPAVADVFGYEPAEVIGKPLTMLMPEELTDRHRAGLREYLDTGERTFDWDEIELPGRHKEGHEIPLSISFSEFSVGDERYFTGIVRDIRDRKRLQAERDLYHETTQRILEAETFQEGLSIAVGAVGDAMNWRYGEAWTCPDGERLERIPDPYVISSAAQTFAEATASVTFERNEGLVGRIWTSGESEWLTDLGTDADAPFDRSAAATEAGFGAALGVPIVSGERVVAVTVFFLAESRAPDEAMVEATTAIAADLGRLMERLEAETALREERNLNDRILETSPVGIVILERDGSFSYVNDRATEILDVDEYEAPLTYGDLDIGLVSFDGEPVDMTGDPYRRVVESADSISGELRIETADGTRWLAVHGAPLLHEDGGEPATVFSLQDMTQRKQRERRLQQHEAVMNTVGDGLYALDAEGRYVVVNDAYADLLGYSREELLGNPASEFIGSRLTDEARALQEQIHDDGATEATLELTLTTASGEMVPVEARISLFELEDGNYGRAGVVRDISERKRREERLARLNEVGQALTTAETPSEVADVVVEGAQEILDLPLTTIKYYDETTGRLTPETRTPELRELIGDAPLFGSEWHLAWRVFVENAERIVDDIAATDAETGETPLGSAIMLPIGEHGVFIAGKPTPGAFSETDVMVARVLVANTVAALDRVDREQELRAQKTRLEEHNDALERLNRLNGVIRGLTQQLVEASTREEVETAVCEELVDTDPYVFAWIGERSAVGDEVRPRTSAGREDGYLEVISVTAGDSPTGDGPAGTAFKSQEPTVMNNLQVDPPFEPWRTQALQRGFRACIAVPLVYRETVYGVLNLYAGDPGVFDEMEVAVLDELGSMIGYAINAIERKKALVGDSAVELTFAVDDTSIPAVEFAAETGGTFEFETFVEQRDGSLRVFFETTGVDPETVYQFSERTPTVQHLSLLTEREDGCRFEVVVSKSSFFADLVSYGAYPTAMRSDPGGSKLTVELPQNGDVSAFIRMFVRRYEGAELSARVDKRRPVRTSAEFEATYRDRLTERQAEVLKTAYFSGFFEWPRETSGKELASLLGIAQPTVSRHIRTSERKLFGLLFDGD